MYELYLFIADYYVLLFLCDRVILREKRNFLKHLNPISMENIVSIFLAGERNLFQFKVLLILRFLLVKTKATNLSKIHY